MANKYIAPVNSWEDVNRALDIIFHRLNTATETTDTVGSSEDAPSFDLKSIPQIMSYKSLYMLKAPYDIPHKAYVDTTISLEVEKAKKSNIQLLNITISDPPTQAEVQAISDKVDEIISFLN